MKILLGDINSESSVAVLNQIRMALLEPQQAIELQIHSGGGDVFEGLNIYNQLKKARYATANIEGLCASMATIVMLGCAKVRMSEASIMMIHNPISVSIGDKKEHLLQAGLVDNLKNIIVGVYAQKTGLSTEELNKMMDETTFLSPQEALKMGFVDEIYSGNKTTQNAIAKVTARMTEADFKAMNDGQKFQTIYNLYPILEQTMDKQNEQPTETAAEKELKAQLALQAKIIAEMQADAKAAAEKANADKVNMLIKSAVAAGKIKAEMTAELTTLGKASPEALEAFLDKMTVPVVTAILPKPTDLLRDLDAKGENPINSERKDWDMRKWEKEDPKGLKELKTSHPQVFDALVKKTYPNA